MQSCQVWKGNPSRGEGLSGSVRTRVQVPVPQIFDTFIHTHSHTHTYMKYNDEPPDFAWRPNQRMGKYEVHNAPSISWDGHQGFKKILGSHYTCSYHLNTSEQIQCELISLIAHLKKGWFYGAPHSEWLGLWHPQFICELLCVSVLFDRESKILCDNTCRSMESL